jgi:hypothetical protein
MHASASRSGALDLFDQRATMGPQSDIATARAVLEESLDDKTKRSRGGCVRRYSPTTHLKQPTKRLFIINSTHDMND